MRGRPAVGLAAGILVAAAVFAAESSPTAGPTRMPTPRPAPGKTAPGSAGSGSGSHKAIGVRVPHRPLAPGDRISLDLKDADIRDVIRTFASLAKINVVIDPEVKGSVTVRLHDVAWEDALDVILRSNGLGSVREDNLMRVGNPARLAGDETR